MAESSFQKNLKEKLKKLFPGCYVFKTDALQLQGVPDLLILYKDKWAGLECKAYKDAPHRPNQDYYVTQFDDQSFARFIYPENEQEVLNELSVYFNN